MNPYEKIKTIFDRNQQTGTLIEGKWRTPEFKYLAKNPWVFTEKIDGTNIRIIFQDGELSVKGRGEESQVPTALIDNIYSRKEEIVAGLSSLGIRECCLYGEGYGDGIQKLGKHYSKDQNFILFDVKIGYWWLKRDSIEEIATNTRLNIVPVIGEGTLEDAVKMVKDGVVSRFGDFEAEGIVAKTKLDLLTRGGKRLVVKIKGKDFLPLVNTNLSE